MSPSRVQFAARLAEEIQAADLADATAAVLHLMSNVADVCVAQVKRDLSSLAIKGQGLDWMKSRN